MATINLSTSDVSTAVRECGQWVEPADVDAALCALQGSKPRSR
jgi:hypothetical protein